jgi:hypothetical protein
MWESLIIEPVLNILMYFYRLSGNLGAAILLLSLGISTIQFMTRAPRLRKEQKKLALGTQWDGRGETQSGNQGNLFSGCLLTVLISSLSIFVTIALIWIFWYVLLPDTEMASNLDSYLWSSPDPAAETFNTHFIYLDLREKDLLRVSWMPFSLPGVIVLLSLALSIFISLVRDVIRKKHKKNIYSRRMMIITLSVVALGILVSGYIFPAGIILYWLGIMALSLVELGLYPLAVVYD